MSQRNFHNDVHVSGQIFEYNQPLSTRYALSGALVEGSGLYQVGPYLHVGTGFGITVSDSGITTKISDLDTRYAQSGLIQYALPIQSLAFNPGNGSTVYLGLNAKIPSITAATSKTYIRRTGTIRLVELYTYAGGTAGSNETITFYLRKNNTADFLINSVSLATAERVFNNTAININMVSGDYFEIKVVCPTWSSKPTTWSIAGYCLFIE